MRIGTGCEAIALWGILFLAACDQQATEPSAKAPDPVATMMAADTMAIGGRSETYVVVTPQGGWKITKTYLQTFVCPTSAPPGEARDVNDNNWIVGWGAVLSRTGGCDRHAFLIRPGQRIRDITNRAYDAEAVAVNNRGTVVGVADGRAFRWTLTTGLQYLPLLAGIPGVPTAIDEGDNIVGTVATASGRRAVLWPAAGGVIDLAPMTDARAVSYGEVYGAAPLGPSGDHAVLRQSDGTLIDLGTQGTGAVATGWITGAIVGNYVDVAGGEHAVFMNRYGQPWTPIPTIGGLLNQANAANAEYRGNSGAVVGWSEIFDPYLGNDREAFFWSTAAGSLRLNIAPPDACGGFDSEARAVNRGGLVVGGEADCTVIGRKPVSWKVSPLP